MTFSRKAAVIITATVTALVGLIVPIAAHAARIQPGVSGPFRILDAELGRCLDNRGSHLNGATLVRADCKPDRPANQSWVVDPVSGSSFAYQIMNTGSGLCLDTQGSSVAANTPVVQFFCDDNRTTQFWNRQTVIPGQGDTNLSTLHPGPSPDNCLDTLVQDARIFPCATGLNRAQLWAFII